MHCRAGTIPKRRPLGEAAETVHGKKRVPVPVCRFTVRARQRRASASAQRPPDVGAISWEGGAGQVGLAGLVRSCRRRRSGNAACI